MRCSNERHSRDKIRFRFENARQRKKKNMKKKKSVNPLPNDKFLDMTKLKAFADDKLNVAKMTISLCGRLENTVGKRRKCWLPAFSSFHTVFSKAFFFRVVKSRDCMVELNAVDSFL